MDNPVETAEVIKSFLAANSAKAIESRKQKGDLAKYFEDQYASLRGISEKELLRRIKDKNRRKRIQRHRWFKRVVPLKYIGGWPRVGDLPRDWCWGSPIDIAERLKDNPGGSFRSAERVFDMVPNIKIILEYFPPILVQGGEVRKNKDLLFLPFDLDDGCHRSIAAALAHIREIRAYVGAM